MKLLKAVVIILWILREPSKAIAEHLSSTEPELKNTSLEIPNQVQWLNNFFAFCVKNVNGIGRLIVHKKRHLKN